MIIFSRAAGELHHIRSTLCPVKPNLLLWYLLSTGKVPLIYVRKLLQTCVCVERMVSSRIICSNYNHEVAHLTLHSFCPVPTGFLSSTSESQAPRHEGREVILGKMYPLACIKHGYPLQTPPPDHFYQLKSHSGWHSLCWWKRTVSSWKSCSMPSAFRGQQLATRPLARLVADV